MSIIVSRQDSRSRHHHDPRAFAWELMMGFPPSRHGSRRAPGRADLPDVDFPAPPPRPRFVAAVVGRLKRLFVRGKAADPVPSAADDRPIGEWVDPPYLRSAQHESRRAGDLPAPDAEAVENIAA
ncbi:MAG: hypothetical protein KF723_20555 [Rhizobiaceae bacterium]|nr:hypothetical protein [Rhizobiaceae bacterium]